jgi:hypothetical protein
VKPVIILVMEALKKKDMGYDVLAVCQCDIGAQKKFFPFFSFHEATTKEGEERSQKLSRTEKDTNAVETA